MDEIKEFGQTGILAGILIGIFMLLFLISIPVRNEREKGLACDIQNVLNVNPDNILKIKDYLLITSPAQTSLAVFSLSGSTHEDLYACIIRITGICGPVPVIFLYSESRGATYEGIAGKSIPFDSYSSAGVSYTQIEYWGNKLTNIIKEALVE